MRSEHRRHRRSSTRRARQRRRRCAQSSTRARSPAYPSPRARCSASSATCQSSKVCSRRRAISRAAVVVILYHVARCVVSGRADAWLERRQCRLQSHFAWVSLLADGAPLIGDPAWDRIAAEAARTVPGRENGGNCDIKNLSRGCAVHMSSVSSNALPRDHFPPI